MLNPLNFGLKWMLSSVKSNNFKFCYAPTSILLNSVYLVPNCTSHHKRHVHYVQLEIKASNSSFNVQNPCEKLFSSCLKLNTGLFRNTCATYRTSAISHCDEQKPGNREKQKLENNSSENKMDKVELDSEFKSYIDEIRKEFGADDLEVKNHLSEDEKHTPDKNSPIPITIQDKYVSYDECDAEIILDEGEIYETLEEGEESFFLKEKKVDEFYGLNLSRGISGVFDIEDIVDVLEQENLQDICVISVPKEKNYANYLVIASSKSERQLNAVSEFIKKLYKKKGQGESFIKVEGEKSSPWKAIDMGNIVVHLFMPETREKYDIEMLWTVGEKYDDLSQSSDPLYDIIQKHSIDFSQFKPLA